MTARPEPIAAREHEIRRLAADGATMPEMAAALGINYAAVGVFIRRRGIRVRKAERGRPRALGAAETAEAPAPAPDPLLDPTAALIATGGRYGALAEWARVQGLSMTQALQRWHRLGLPPKARGQA